MTDTTTSTDNSNDQAEPVLASSLVVGIKDLAKFLRLSEMRVDQLVQDGVLEKLARGRYSLQKCVGDYCEYQRGVSRGSDSAKLEQQARTRLTNTKAEIAELDRAERAGELVRAEVVQTQGRTLAEILKNNLFSIADRSAPILAAETDQGKIHDTLTQEINTCLTEVVDKMQATEVDDARLDITRRLALDELDQVSQETEPRPELDS